jgi:hypothetical protein
MQKLILIGATLAAALSTLPAQRDSRAGFRSLLGATASPGSQAPRLAGGAPPILGKVASLQLQAQGYDLAVLLVADRIAISPPLKVGTAELVGFVPLHSCVTLPVPLRAGAGALSLGIPASTALLGRDVAMQSVAASLARPGTFGASQLVVANPGTSDLIGTLSYAVFQDPVRGGKVPGMGWFGVALSGGFRHWTVYESDYQVLEVQVCFSGTSNGNLVLDDDTNAGNGNLGTIVPVGGDYKFCIWVKPGQKVYVYNPAAAATDFTMTVDETNWR